jgi:U3 small nucleolar RNA-associated protein 25
MGIQLNPGHGKGSGPAKGVYMRLFSDFFISDIILASPLGLRLAMGKAPKTGDKHKDNANKGKNNDLSPDFLSSVEVVLMHQADVMYMQNWDHVEFIMKYTNKLPTAAHDTDFSRVRQYFLEGHADKHRQLLVTSHFNQPDLQAFFRENARSIAGSIRLKKHWGKGQLSNVIGEVKQVFQLVPGVKDFESQEDARFKYFKDSVLAPLVRLEQNHTLIVTPSYFSYVRVRNELMKQDVRNIKKIAYFSINCINILHRISAQYFNLSGERRLCLRVQQRQRDFSWPLKILPRQERPAALLRQSSLL